MQVERLLPAIVSSFSCKSISQLAEMMASTRGLRAPRAPGAPLGRRGKAAARSRARRALLPAQPLPAPEALRVHPSSVSGVSLTTGQCFESLGRH